MSKSLTEIEQLADSMLLKSLDTKKSEPADVTPADISEGGVPENKEDTGKKLIDTTEDEDDKEEDEDKKEDEDIEKSIRTSFDTEPISQAFEVSEFLASVVEAVTKSLVDMGVTMNKSLSNSDSTLETFAKSFRAIAQVQETVLSGQQTTNELCKSMGTQMDALSQRLESIESQPQMRKSLGNVNVNDRNFSKSISTGETTLSKSQTMGILNTEVYKGNPLVSVTDIISYESGAPLRREVQDLVNMQANK